MRARSSRHSPIARGGDTSRRGCGEACSPPRAGRRGNCGVAAAAGAGVAATEPADRCRSGRNRLGGIGERVVGTAASRQRDGQQQHAGDDDRAEPGEQRIDGAQPELGRQRRHRGERDQIARRDPRGTRRTRRLVVERVLEAIVAASAGRDLSVGRVGACVGVRSSSGHSSSSIQPAASSPSVASRRAAWSVLGRRPVAGCRASGCGRCARWRRRGGSLATGGGARPRCST